MEFALYLLLGSMDLLAILALIFKMFRFPLWKNKMKIIMICLSLSAVSLVMRLVLDIPEYDMGLQFVLFALLFRYLLKFRTFEALTLSTIGFLTFDLSQLIVISIFLAAGFSSIEDIVSATGLGTYLIQGGTQATLFLISWNLYNFKLGFSFIMNPPHNLNRKTKMAGENFLLFIGIILGAIAISSTMVFMFNYYNKIHYVFLAVAAVLLLMMLVSNKKDLSDI